MKLFGPLDVEYRTPLAPVKRERFDISKPRYDQDTFVGRYKHFFQICNPLKLFKSDAQLTYAKDVFTRYKDGEDFPSLSDDEIWEQKAIYESAFHPVNEEKMLSIGRISAQCPINTLIMGAMLVFHKTTGQIVLWQWINQSFNSIVNHVNASDPQQVSFRESAKNYATAVSLALGSSLILNSMVNKLGALVRNLVPFGATSLANSINIPIMRQSEIKNGIDIWYEGIQVAKSKKMAIRASRDVIVSRIAISTPHMVLIPLAINHMNKTGFSKRHPRVVVPFQFMACGVLLLFTAPMGCALFPQKTFVSVDKLEPEVQEQLKQLPEPPSVVYYNKGL